MCKMIYFSSKIMIKIQYVNHFHQYSRPATIENLEFAVHGFLVM